MVSPTYSGLVHSRQPSSGLKRVTGEILTEDGSLPFSMFKRASPEIAAAVEERASELERAERDAVSFRFSYQNQQLLTSWVAPLEREPAASVTIAVSLVKEALLSKEDALLRIEPSTVERILAPVFSAAEAGRATRDGRLLCQGDGKGVEAVSGYVAADLLTAFELQKQGKPVILVCPRLTYSERDALPIISGFVVTQEPVQAALLFDKPGVIIDSLAEIVNQTEVSLDPVLGRVFRGRMDVLAGSVSHDLMQILAWADEIRDIEIRANVATAQEVEYARAFGARGVGLCRIESLFQKPERLGLFARVLKDVCLRRTSDSLATLQQEIQDEVKGLFQAAGSDEPFILRLLDVPLSQMLRFWRDGHYVETDYFEGPLKDWLQELNPLGGLRFGRLSLLYPELLKLQIRAILRAWKDQPVKLQIMMPGVTDAEELRILRGEVQAEASSLKLDLPLIGSMLETPRACLTIEELASEGDFFSFGTGDLTESTCGISRYDGPLSFLNAYVEKGIFSRDPFESLDQSGVGKLMKQAVAAAKKENPTVELGTCGAQAVEEESLSFCRDLGLDYVSVPMLRLPATRLSAARVKIRSSVQTK